MERELKIIENELVPVYETSTGEKLYMARSCIEYWKSIHLIGYGQKDVLVKLRQWKERILKVYKFVHLPDKT